MQDELTALKLEVAPKRSCDLGRDSFWDEEEKQKGRKEQEKERKQQQRQL